MRPIKNYYVNSLLIYPRPAIDRQGFPVIKISETVSKSTLRKPAPINDPWKRGIKSLETILISNSLLGLTLVMCEPFEVTMTTIIPK